MSYSGDHASALADVRDAGAAVSFTRKTGATYDAENDQFVGGSADTISGHAVEIPGDPKRYERLGLVQRKNVTLLFAPTAYGEVPDPGYHVTWGSVGYAVKDVTTVAPDGTAILATVVCSV